LAGVPAGTAHIDHDVTTILPDRKGAIWAGTRTGYLVRMDPLTGRHETILKGGDEGISRTLLALEEDRLGRIWIGASGGLLRLDPATGETKSGARSGRTPRPGLRRRDLEQERAPVVRPAGRLQRLDVDGTVIQRLTNVPDDPSSLSDDYVTSLLEDRRGRLWVGTRSGGLNEIDAATGRARRFLPVAGDPSSLGHRFVTSLLQD
jgi:ligand-binding sensor domain-containing protein